MTLLDTYVPDCLSGCQNCAYRIKSLAEAADLLQNVIRQAHMQAIEGGGLLLEAKLDPRRCGEAVPMGIQLRGLRALRGLRGFYRARRAGRVWLAASNVQAVILFRVNHIK